MDLCQKGFRRLLRCSSVLATLVSIALSAHGQAHYDSRIYVGGHAGVNLSRVQFTPSVSQGFNPGANVGLNFRYIEEKHFGLIVEANWEQRGWKESFKDLPYSYSRTVNYIQIPFLAHIYFGTRGKFFINAGPSLSFMVGESTKSNFDFANAATMSDFKNRIWYQYLEPVKQKVDYGISAGIGGEFGITPQHSVYLDARLYYGLGNMLKSGRTENIRGSNSLSISVSAGYWFRMK